MIDPTGWFVVPHSSSGDLVGGDANVDDDGDADSADLSALLGAWSPRW